MPLATDTCLFLTTYRTPLKKSLFCAKQHKIKYIYMFCVTIYCMQKQFFSGAPIEVGVISQLIFLKLIHNPWCEIPVCLANRFLTGNPCRIQEGQSSSTVSLHQYSFLLPRKQIHTAGKVRSALLLPLLLPHNVS